MNSSISQRPDCPLEAAVEAPGQEGRPVLDRDARLDVDFRAVAGVRVAPRGEDPGVHLGAEAEPPPAVAAVESDPPEALLLGQLANGDLEDLDGSSNRTGTRL